MYTPKRLISLHPISHPKTAPDKETGTPNQEFFSPMRASRERLVDNGDLSQGIFWREEALSAIIT